MGSAAQGLLSFVETSFGNVLRIVASYTGDYNSSDGLQFENSISEWLQGPVCIYDIFIHTYLDV